MVKYLLKVFIVCALLISFVSKAQTIYPLRTFTDIPENAYLKDTNNELSSYEGTWNNKTIYITLKKMTYKYDNVLKRYRDYLVGKFKVLDNDSNVLFDNTSIADEVAKIEGGKFKKKDGKYSLGYSDSDLCGMSGRVEISFTDSTKTKLLWEYSKDVNWIDTDCYYYGKPASERPDPLPYKIILTKQ